jgi:hypothetical protein
MIVAAFVLAVIGGIISVVQRNWATLLVAAAVVALTVKAVF